MSTVTLNIGLNNNPYSPIIVEAEINQLALDLGFKVQIRIDTGEYSGIPEPTIIARFEQVVGYFDIEDKSLWRNVCENLCQDYTQDCIPFLILSDDLPYGELVYNPHYKGNKYKFSDDYFLRF